MEKIGTGIVGGLVLACVVGLNAQQNQSAPIATVPHLVRISNTYHPANGLPVSPVESATLSIYSEQQGGTPLWQETQNVTVDSEGHYLAMMGATLPEGVPLDLFSSGQQRWLGVLFNRPGETEQARVQLVSVPYALKASDADTLGGLPASAYMVTGSAGTSAAAGQAQPAQTASEASGIAMSTKSVQPRINASGATTNYIPMFTDSSGDLSSSMIWQSSQGYIGVGTQTPASPLTIGGTFSSVGTAIAIPNNSNYGGFDSTNIGRGLLWMDNAGLTTSSGDVVHIRNNQRNAGGSISLETQATGLPSVTILKNGNMGIGSTTPAYPLTIGGTYSSTGTAIAIPDNSSYGGFDSARGGRSFLWMDSSAPDVLHIRNNQRSAGGSISLETQAGGVPSVTVTSGGRVGIGTMSPSTMLDVMGPATMESGLSISGSSPALSVAGNTTITGTLAAGATTLSGTLSGAGGSTGTVAVTNNETVGGTLGVAGNTTLSGTLGVAGNTTITGANNQLILASGTGGIKFPDNSVQTTAASGGLSGGTANTIPVWSGASTLGLSPLSVSGGNVTSTDAISAPSLSTTTGNITAATGNITATAGNITATAGMVTGTTVGTAGGSINTAGLITGTALTTGAGAISGGAITGTSLGSTGGISVGSNLSSPTATIATDGTITGTSLAAGSGAISTTGSLSAGDTTIAGTETISGAGSTAGALTISGTTTLPGTLAISGPAAAATTLTMSGGGGVNALVLTSGAGGGIKFPDGSSQTTAASGGLSGGTANTIPLWTSSSALGNSSLTVSSGNVTNTGSITAASFSTAGGINATGAISGGGLSTTGTLGVTGAATFNNLLTVTSGGIKFPDGNTQTTAATISGGGSVGGVAVWGGPEMISYTNAFTLSGS